MDKPLEAKIYCDRDLKRCAVCGKPYVPNRGGGGVVPQERLGG